jgi:hypothetical protein
MVVLTASALFSKKKIKSKKSMIFMYKMLRYVSTTAILHISSLQNLQFGFLMGDSMMAYQLFKLFSIKWEGRMMVNWKESLLKWSNAKYLAICPQRLRKTVRTLVF